MAEQIVGLPVEQCQPDVFLAGYFNFTDEPWFRYRQNDFHQWMLPDVGTISVQRGDHTLNAKPGDLLCLGPVPLNEYRLRGTTRFLQACLNFVPPPYADQPLWMSGVGPLPLKIALGDHLSEVRGLFETICLSVDRPGMASRMRIRAAVFQILSIIVGICQQEGPKNVTFTPWERLRLRLDCEPGTEIKIRELAREMECTPEHLIRTFKKHFGVTPKRYHTRARLREAAMLIRRSDRSIKSIAYAMGFSDAKTFARRFKGEFHVAPSALRSVSEEEAGEPAHFFPINRHLSATNFDPSFFSQIQLEQLHVMNRKERKRSRP